MAQVMAEKGLTESYKKFIGFARFQDYLTRKIEMMFSEATAVAKLAMTCFLSSFHAFPCVLVKFANLEEKSSTFL